MKRVLSLCLMALSLTGCLSTIRLNERAIVQAVGIDLAEGGGYRMTLQICEVQSSGGPEDSEQVAIIEETGTSITEIITKASVTRGKQMFLGNCQLLVIGAEAARAGANNVLNFFNANYRVNPSMAVAVAGGEAAEIIRAQEKSPQLDAEGILEILDSAYQAGYAPRSRLFDLMNAIHSDHLAGAATMLVLEQEPQEKPESAAAPPESEGKPEGESSEESEKSGEAPAPRLRVAGMGLFRGDRLESALDTAGARGYSWTQNSIKSTPVTVEDERLGRVSVVDNRIKANIFPKLTGDIMVYHIHLTVQGAALETVLNSGERLTDADKTYAVALQERLIVSEIEKMIRNTEKSGYDLMGLSLLTRQRYPAYYEEHAEDWEETLRLSGFSVEVDCEINRSGVDNRLT